MKKCALTKTIYDALEAQRKATAKILESRSGILSTEGEISRLNEILIPLVKQGQSIHQIYLNNRDELMQADIDLMMDHINLYRRKKLNGKSPYEAFCFYYGKNWLRS